MPSEPFPPHVLDIEASGFGAGSYPIEIGLVTPDNRAWCSLVRPEPHWQRWDQSAAAVHHITREQLKLFGRPATEVASSLNEWLGGQTVYTDAWAHDYAWLHNLFEVAERTMRFKLDNLHRLLSEDEADRWHATKDKVASGMATQRHRASHDARLLQMTLVRVRQQATDPINATPLSQP